MHPGDGVVTEDDWALGSERCLPLAGPGTPEVAEFCIAEFALAIGLSTDAGRRSSATRSSPPPAAPGARPGRLGGCRRGGPAGSPAATRSLPAAAAEFVDRHVAGVAHRIGLAALDRLVAEALTRFDPEQAEDRRREAAEQRASTSTSTDIHDDGTVDIDRCPRPARRRRPRGRPTRPARPAQGRRLHRAARTYAAPRPSGCWPAACSPPTPGRPATPAADHAARAHHRGRPGSGSGLVRVEETRGFLGIGRLAQWCTDPATQIDVKPVIDLNGHIGVEAYEVPDRLAEQTRLRDHTCVFPALHPPRPLLRPGPPIPYSQGGATCSCNIAPLCRSHHRLKTHGGWTYTSSTPAPTCGAARTATPTSATTTAPSTSPHPTEPTSDRPHPTPAADTHIADPRRVMNSQSTRFC